MNLNDKTIDLLENNDIARRIIKYLLDAQFYHFTYVEGKDPKATTGSMLRFDCLDKEVHGIADELVREGILDSHTPIILPVYYLKGEKPREGTATPRNEELRKTIVQYFK